MARKILIITGSTILLILFSLWIYLLIFSTPGETGRWFLGGLGDPTPVAPAIETEVTSQLVIPDAALTQLTTKSVAGYDFITVGSSTATTTADYRLRYAETGTGHIYEIDLNTAVETRISGITVGQTVEAHFDPNGEAFVLTAERGNSTASTIYLFDTEAEKYTDLPLNSRHFKFTGNDSLLYTVIENDRTIAYELDWENLETNTLWSIPLAQINVSWTESGAVVSSKVSNHLKSGIYEITGGEITRLVAPLPALSMVNDPVSNTLWYSYFDANTGQDVAVNLNRESSEVRLATLPAIPEKCFRHSNDREVCAVSASLLSETSSNLNRWYRGEFTSDDRLWVSTETGAAYEANLSELAGHTIDVTDIAPTPDYNAFYFINKTNRTLWRYQFSN